MKRRHRRLGIALASVLLVGLAAILVLRALNDTVTFFYSPSDLAALPTKPVARIRVGGLVSEGSLETLPGSEVRFVITDLNQTLIVQYKGLLPNLFREGQGVVAGGRVDASGTFIADEVLAKHDETYMPPEVAAALKAQGEWRPEMQDSSAPKKN